MTARCSCPAPRGTRCSPALRVYRLNAPSENHGVLLGTPGLGMPTSDRQADTAMRDLAPDITRQRLLIEGHFAAAIDRPAVERYLLGLAEHLALTTYGTPVIHSPAGAGKPENQGFDAFIPLIDSGISLYVWSARRFFAVLLFTCKRFDVERALEFTRRRLEAPELEHRSF